MKNVRRPRRRIAARMSAAAAVVSLAFFTLVAPLLVLCRGAGDHVEVEAALALCCVSGAPAGSAMFMAPEACVEECVDTPLVTGSAMFMAPEACVEECVDTPLVTGADVPCPRPLAVDGLPAGDVRAVVAIAESGHARAFVHRFGPPPAAPTGRLTVLRI